MGNKINIARLLKDSPKGMELECTMFDDVKFISVEEANKPICIRTGDIYRYLTKFGTWTFDDNAKCVIFPKGKTTWEGFQRPFKDGDIIFTHANCLKVGLGNTWISIFQENRNGGVATYVDYAENGSDYYSNIDGDKAFLCMEEDILCQRLATEEEKEKLFQAIKDNGYRWNAETKTLEKLVKPKFKVGNKIKYKNGKNINGVEQGVILSITDNAYDVAVTNDMGIIVPIANQDNWELVLNKFDITTLNPFDNCKYSLDNGRTWKFAQYWFIQEKYNTNDIDIELWQG